MSTKRIHNTNENGEMTEQLKAMLEKARERVITPEEARAQAISFAYWNCAIDNPNITREMVEHGYDQLFGNPAKRDAEIAEIKRQNAKLHEEYANRIRMLVECGGEIVMLEHQVADLKLQLAETRKDTERSIKLLTELHATVWGECPSLLNEDSGGDAMLDSKIREAIDAAREARPETKERE